MKRFLAVVAALCAMVAMYAVAAPAGQQGVSPAKFNKLVKQVKKLKKQVGAINGELACFTSAVPLTQYQGYVYGDVTDPSAFKNTTALDVTAQGDPVGAWVLEVDSRCVTTGSASHFRPLASPRLRAHH